MDRSAPFRRTAAENCPAVLLAFLIPFDKGIVIGKWAGMQRSGGRAPISSRALPCWMAGRAVPVEDASPGLGHVARIKR